MFKYAKIIDTETGLCNVGLGTNVNQYISFGMEPMDVKQSDVDNQWYLADKCPMKTDADKIEEREKQFEADFFLTSLGYIRRKVTMSNGDTKDFLSDLLPSIAMGIQLGQPVTIITYKKPDFSKNLTDLTQYQEAKQATEHFMQECFTQLNNDFLPVKPNTEANLETK